MPAFCYNVCIPAKIKEVIMKIEIKGSFDSKNLDTGYEQTDYNEITNFGVDVILSSISRLDTKRWRSIRLIDTNGNIISEKQASFELENLAVGSYRLKSSARFDASDVTAFVYKIQMVGGTSTITDVVATANITPALSPNSSYLIVRNDSVVNS